MDIESKIMTGVNHIFLFGHRKRHGKNVCASILENILKERNLDYCSTYFAKELKKLVANKYNLDFDKMECGDYKNSKPCHLNNMSVRDALIKEGVSSRDIWKSIWSSKVYSEIINSNKPIGIVSDYRFPNEYTDAKELHNVSLDRVHRILVHRPNGVFLNDGADDQLPDDQANWDYVIMNDVEDDEWMDNLTRQVLKILNKVIG